jgi:hypothetical protein
MAKKILIEYDVDSKDLKIAGQETLSLTQQLRILKKELQRGDLKPEQFEILRKRIGDTEDQIARTTTRSKDFLGVLATLPGPVGSFGSSILSVVDTLKIFAGFSFKDIKNSLGDLLDDVEDITRGFFGIKDSAKEAETASKALASAQTATAQSSSQVSQNSIAATTNINATAGAAGAAALSFENLSKQQRNAIVHGQAFDATTGKVTTAAENMAAAQNKTNQAIGNSVVATNTATVATNALTFAQRAATIAANALKIALASIGIGLIIMAITFLIQKIAEWTTSTEEADAANQALTETLKEQERQLNVNLEAIDQATKLQKLRAQVAGQTEEQIYQIVKKGGEDRLAELRRYDEELYQEQRKLSKNLTLTAEQREAKNKELNEKLLKSNLDIIKQINANEEALLQEQLRVANLRRERGKKSADDEYARKLKELDALIQLEIDKDKTDEKRLADYLDRKMKLIMTKEKLSAAEQELMRQQNAQKVKQALDDDAQRLIDYFKKIEDIRIDAIEDDEQARLEARENKLYFDKIALSKDKEFVKKSEEEKAEVIKNLEIATQQDLLKIREEFFIKKYQLELDQATAFVDLQTKLKEQENNINNVRLQQLGDFTAVYGDYFFGNKGLKALYAMYFVDLRQAYTDEFNANNAIFDAEQGQLISALDNKIITQEKYDEKLRELNEKRLQNNEEFTQRQIQLDQLEVDSKRASADKTVEIGAQLVNLLSAVAGKSKGIQIAAALTEAGVAIARIIIDTQRAIIAFSASVAPLGPAGVPIAAGYAVKAKIAAALSIATIVAQGINKLKEIKSAGSEEGGGQQSNGLGRGYADGGIVRGPGGPKSDSINARLSNGEAVMTSGAVTMFAPLLSMMNQMGGGAAFTSSLNTALPDRPAVAQPSLEQSEMIVKTYVVEKELTDAQHRQARLKNLSTL